MNYSYGYLDHEFELPEVMDEASSMANLERQRL